MHRAVHGNITGAPLTYSTSKLKHATAGTYHPHMSVRCVSAAKNAANKAHSTVFRLQFGMGDMEGQGSGKRPKRTLPLIHVGGCSRWPQLLPFLPHRP